MRIDIDPNPEETRRACAAILQASLPKSRANLILFGLYLAIGVVAFVFTPVTWTTTFAIGVASVVASTIALQADSRSRLRRLRASDPHANESHFVELSAEGVHCGCEHLDSRYPWRDFSQVAENREFYLFVRPSGNGSAVPKRLLSREQEAALRTCIQEWSADKGARLAKQ